MPVILAPPGELWSVRAPKFNISSCVNVEMFTRNFLRAETSKPFAFQCAGIRAVDLSDNLTLPQKHNQQCSGKEARMLGNLRWTLGPGNILSFDFTVTFVTTG